MGQPLFPSCGRRGCGEIKLVEGLEGLSMGGAMTGRFSVGIALSSLLAMQASPAAQQSAPGRALAIEDYYHVQTVTNPQISPDGRWVIFAVGTRIEQDNSTRSEVLVVPAD